MKILALVEDGFREARDRRISTVLFALSLLVAGMCASVAFEPPGPGDLEYAAAQALSERSATRSLRWTIEPAGSGAVAVRAEDFERARRALEANGFSVEPLGHGLLRATAADPLALPGASLRFAFSERKFPLGSLSVRGAIAEFELFLANAIAGWIGVIIAIVVTSGFVPSMLQSGSIHVLLAKPVRRPFFILGKYAGGVVFVLAHAGVLIGLSWVALSARAGWWDPSFLWLVAVAGGTFAVVYAVSVLVGVLFKSGTLAALLSLGLWAISSIANQARTALAAFGEAGEPVPSWVRDGVEIVYWMLPKTHDLGILARKIVAPDSAARVSEEFAHALAGVDHAASLGSTAAFAAAMLAAACLAFWRKDY